MKVAIRYYSRGGHVEAMAEALSRGTGVEAISIDEPGAKITEHLDLLFIGGALYNFMLDPLLKQYLEDLPEGMIDEAVCFGSSWLTRRPLFIIQDVLKAKNIKINKQAIWSRNRPNDNLLEAIEYFGKNEMIRDRSLDGLPPYLIFKRSQEIKEAKEAAAAAGEEYVPDETERERKARLRKIAEEAKAEAEQAEAAAREAEEAARAAAIQAAETARVAAEKAKAAAAAAEVIDETPVAVDESGEQPDSSMTNGR
ncbi:MAG: hypothetical protein J6D34_11450 [Atopobiaceae bacterium]|nr:hypothetical protein [Atopobiaceae bacterium]